MAAPAHASPWETPSRPSCDAPARDLRSTSTVTSSSRSDSPASSRAPPSPRAACADDDSPPPPPPPSSHAPHSARALPRCGLVNFRKEGDSLRWAPRVAQSTSGVAARVHNFEDAFSLEEFSSRALPVVWRARGGNPRTSAATDDDDDKLLADEPHHQLRSALSTPLSDASAPPPVARSARPPEKKRNKSALGQSHRSLARNNSVKKAVALASEVGRPSFWSFLAHTNKYQRAKAKARLQNDAAQHTPKPTRSHAPSHTTHTDRPDAAAPPRKHWTDRAGHKASRQPRAARATRRAGSRANPRASNASGASLFRRLVDQIDRRNAKNPVFPPPEQTQRRDAERTRFSTSDGGCAEPPERIVFTDNSGAAAAAWRQGRHSEGFISGRRVVSSLSGHTGRKERRKMSANGAQDDQYVTFMTSVS